MKIKHRCRMPRLDSARNHLWHQVIAVIELYNGQVPLIELGFVPSFEPLCFHVRFRKLIEGEASVVLIL